MAQRDMHAALVAASQSGVIAPFFAVSVVVASATVRMWTGYGPLRWDGYVWEGGGHLLGLSEISETSDVRANGVTFRLGGVAPELVSLALSEIRQGWPACVWLGALDDQGAIIGEPVLLFRGLTDVPSLDDGADSVTLSLSAENELVDLERPRIRRYTDEDQKVEYRKDRGFEYVPSLQEKQILFGGG